MRRRLMPILLGWLACLSGCHQIAVYVEHDPSATFTGLSTYGWTNAQPPAGVNDIDDSRIRGAVEKELANRGYTKDEGGSPDFLVGYSAAVETSLQTVTVDRYHGYRQTAYLSQSGAARNRPRSTQAQQKYDYAYQQGSLILDVSRPEPKRLIWRAYARAAMDPGESQSVRDARLEQAVREMLAKFPP